VRFSLQLSEAMPGSADDMLAIYLVNPSGRLDGPIWSESLKGGLDAHAAAVSTHQA
jgi:hypothetical protein